MEVSDKDFDLAFKETMIYYDRLKTHTPDELNLIASALGTFEQAVRDKFPTEHIMAKIRKSAN